MKLFRIGPVFFAMSITLLLAQGGGVQRTVVQRGDISVPGREAVAVRIEIAPGVPRDVIRMRVMRRTTCSKANLR